MSYIIDWQLEVVSLFGNLEDVHISIGGDGTTNTCVARHLPSGLEATHRYPRAPIKTSEDQTREMMVAVDKLFIAYKEKA